VTFSLVKDTPGTYEIVVGKLSSTLVVKKKPEPSSVRPAPPQVSVQAPWRRVTEFHEKTVNYMITILDSSQHLAKVELLVKVPENRSTLTFRGRKGIDPYLKEISFASASGRPLPYTYEQDPYTYEQDQWRVNAQGSPSVTATYVVEINEPMERHPGKLSHYLTKNWGLILGSHFFVYPEITLGQDEVAITFETADFLTHPAFFVATNIGELCDNFVGIGSFLVETSHIEATELIVAIGGATLVDESLIFSAARSTMEYYKGFLQYSKPRYVLFVMPPPIGDGTALAASSFVSTNLHQIPGKRPQGWGDYDCIWVLPHEMFHSVMSKGDHWFGEGFTQYYGYLGSVQSGLWTKEDLVKQVVEIDWKQYEEIRGTVWDCALVDWEEKYAETSNWYYYDYLVGARKPVFVALLLDKQIRDVTNGIKTLEDVMGYIQEHHGQYTHENAAKGQRYPDLINASNVVDAVNQVTGQSFQTFFDEYIYGVGHLSLKSVCAAIDVVVPSVITDRDTL